MELSLTAGWLTKFGRGLKFYKLAVDQNIRFSTLCSQGAALFQQLSATLMHL